VKTAQQLDEQENRVFAEIDKLFIRQEDIDGYNGYEDAASIRSASHWQEDVLDRLNTEPHTLGRLLPWDKTSQHVQIRPGELSIWAGYNGHMKSMILNQVIFDLITQGDTACIASLEMKPVTTLTRMVKQATAYAVPQDNLVADFFNYLHEKLYLYDQYNTVPAKRILQMTRYCAEQLKLNHIVIDSLMKCGMGVDDYNRHRKFIDELTAIAKGTGVHIHLVAHMKKAESAQHQQDKFGVSGHADITNMADNVYIVWKDKKKEHEKNKPEFDRDMRIMDNPDHILTIDKQREGEWEGRVSLWFDPKSLQFTQFKENITKNYRQYFTEA